MRLVLNARSKNHITYIPDTLIIEAKGKTYEYDIISEVVYKREGLDCEVKGDLEIIDDGDFKEMTSKDKSQLISLLNAAFIEGKTITVTVQPADDSDDQVWVDAVNNDEFSEGYGSIIYNKGWMNATFKFKPVFQGF